MDKLKEDELINDFNTFYFKLSFKSFEDQKKLNDFLRDRYKNIFQLGQRDGLNKAIEVCREQFRKISLVKNMKDYANLDYANDIRIVARTILRIKDQLKKLIGE